MPLKDGFIENHSELIYTGVDNAQNKTSILYY